MITFIAIETAPWELFDWGAALHEQSNPSNFSVTEQSFRAMEIYTDTETYSLLRQSTSLSEESEVPFRIYGIYGQDFGNINRAKLLSFNYEDLAIFQPDTQG